MIYTATKFLFMGLGSQLQPGGDASLGGRLINEENRKMPGSDSVTKKVELKADKCDIHPDDGLEQKLCVLRLKIVATSDRGGVQKAATDTYKLLRIDSKS
nr:hypothetical protein [Tanacetum cinerariifolium]